MAKGGIRERVTPERINKLASDESCHWRLVNELPGKKVRLGQYVNKYVESFVQLELFFRRALHCVASDVFKGVLGTIHKTISGKAFWFGGQGFLARKRMRYIPITIHGQAA